MQSALKMGVLFLRTSLRFPCAVTFSSSVHNAQPRSPLVINLQDRYPSMKLRKRTFLKLIAINPFFLYVNPVFGAPIMDTEGPEVIRTLKLASGVKIQEIIEGAGTEAREGDTVEVNYVCRRSNGYFVHSTVNQFSGESSPIVLPLDESQIIMGLKEVLIGMRVGDLKDLNGGYEMALRSFSNAPFGFWCSRRKRRALIPPLVGYINDTLQPIPEEFGPRRSLLSHRKEPLIFEVQLLKVL